MPLKYYCEPCNKYFSNKTDSFEHINTHSHKKNIIKKVLTENKNTENDIQEYRDIFTTKEENIQREFLFCQMKRVETVNNDERNIFICKFCGREYIRKKAYEEHILNTCTVKKDNTFELDQIQIEQEEDERTEREQYIQNICDELNIENILIEKDKDDESKLENETYPEIEIED